MQLKSSGPNLSRTAFVDWDTLDFQADSLLVLTKVFNYGIWSDLLAHTMAPDPIHKLRLKYAL